jgi:CheY-like chemotaxis protein
MELDVTTATIILADDEESNRAVAQLNLALVGFDADKIIEVEDGEEAISKLEELQSLDEGPIIVLLDLHMPGGMDGNITALRIRDNLAKYTRRRPFLVCCSAEVIDDLKGRHWAPAFDYFASKPLVTKAIEDLVDACNNWLAKTATGGN